MEYILALILLIAALAFVVYKVREPEAPNTGNGTSSGPRESNPNEQEK